MGVFLTLAAILVVFLAVGFLIRRQERQDRARRALCATCLGMLPVGSPVTAGDAARVEWLVDGSTYCGLECYLARPAKERKELAADRPQELRRKPWYVVKP